MTSISHLYFSSWSSSGLVKDFPCKHLIDTTYVLLHFYQVCLDRKELLPDFKNRPSMIVCLNFVLYKYSKTTSANRPVNSASHIPLLSMTWFYNMRSICNTVEVTRDTIMLKPIERHIYDYRSFSTNISQCWDFIPAKILKEGTGRYLGLCQMNFKFRKWS
jgi:hypothetical protein